MIFVVDMAAWTCAEASVFHRESPRDACGRRVMAEQGLSVRALDVDFSIAWLTDIMRLAPPPEHAAAYSSFMETVRALIPLGLEQRQTEALRRLVVEMEKELKQVKAWR